MWEALEGDSASILANELFTKFREFAVVLAGPIGGLCDENARNRKKAYDAQELRSSSIPEAWLQRRLGYGKGLEMHVATNCGGL